MSSSSLSGIMRVVLLSASIGLTVVQGAVAACYGPAQQLPAQTVADFLKDPGQMLSAAGNGDGGAAVVTAIRDLAASNPTTLPAIIALLGSANAAQQAAIGTGLGQAAAACAVPDPTYAASIQQQLAASTSEAAKTAYAAATGNKPIGSVAGGGTGGGVSGGASGGSTGALASVGGGVTPALQGFAVSGALNTGTNYFTSSVSGASSGSVSATAATSVSP
jgi:hypothetical protein